jgi:hypothetical protein
MLAQEPYLQFLSTQHLADDKIVGAVIPANARTFRMMICCASGLHGHFGSFVELTHDSLVPWMVDPKPLHFGHQCCALET